MSDVSLFGSCLCGSVSYEISGDATRFWHCHCRRCRKATGTGHASNIIINPDLIRWSKGKDLLTRYKVPEAERFATTFCSICGSLLPRVAPDNSLAVIPAGSLDNDPGLRPQGRIFQASRAEWSCEDTDLPCFDRYPE